MKKKVIIFALLVAVFLSSCTVNVWKYQHWDWTNEKPVYKLVYSIRKGPVEPVIDFIDPYRTHTPRGR